MEVQPRSTAGVTILESKIQELEDRLRSEERCTHTQLCIFILVICIECYIRGVCVLKCLLCVIMTDQREEQHSSSSEEVGEEIKGRQRRAGPGEKPAR